jgi:anti-sigma factor RsiW
VSRGLDGRLSAAEAEAMESHLAGCPGCAAWREAVGGAARVLGAEPAAEVPRDLADRSVRAAWARELASDGEEGLADRLVGVGRLGLAAAGLAAVLLLALAAVRGPRAVGNEERGAGPALIDLAGEGPDPAAALVAPGRGSADPGGSRRTR